MADMHGITIRTSRGARVFQVRLRLDGCKKFKTFPTLIGARQWRDEQRVGIAQGIISPTSAHTVGEMIARYLEKDLPEKSARNYKPVLAWWRSQIGGKRLAEVSRADLIELRDRMEVSNSSKNRYCAYIATVFSKAVYWEWIKASPFHKFQKLPEPRGRTRFLSDEERQRLLDACRQNPDLYVLVVLALSSGMRKSEMLTLRWRQVDFNSQTIKLLDSKNGDQRLVPLVEPALSILRERSKVRRIDSEFIFPAKNGNRSWQLTSKEWKRKIEKAGLVNFRVHDMRHSAASVMAMSGMSVLEIAAVLGHRTLAMTMRYAHVADAHLVDRVGAAMRRSFGG